MLRWIPSATLVALLLCPDVHAAPSVLFPADGSVIGTAQPVVSGTGDPLGGITLLIDGTAEGSTVASDAGSWSVPVIAALPDGVHTAQASALDATGDAGTLSAVNSFTVDTSAPGAPFFTSPAQGATVGALPTVNGFAESFASVTVFLDGVQLGTAPVDGSSRFGFALVAPLGEGQHQLTAFATDVAGNAGPSSSPRTFTVDRTPPPVPQITSPAEGYTTHDALQVFGTAEAQVGIQLFVDGVLAGTTTSDGNGDWILAASTSLSEGPHVAEARSVDALGNASAPSTALHFVFDSVPPPVPVLVHPMDGAVLGGQVVAVDGTGEPGSTVLFSLDGVFGGGVPVDAGGAFSFFLSTGPLSAGGHSLSFTAVDDAANFSAASAPSFFTLDFSAPPAPAITSPADGTFYGSPAVALAGTAVPDSIVHCLISGGAAAITRSDASGAWACSVNLADGAWTLQASVLNALGNESAPSAGVQVFVNGSGGLAPGYNSPRDGDLVRENPPLIHGYGAAGNHLLVTLDDLAAVELVVDAQGGWLFQVGAPLAEGPHTLRGTYLASAFTSTLSFTLDTVPPDAPHIAYPAVDAWVPVGALTLSGGSEPGAQVLLVLDQHPLAALAQADSTGAWSMAAASPLAEGLHTLSALAFDRAGNPGPALPTFSFRAIVGNGLNTTLTSGPQRTTKSTSATFVFTGNAPGTFECALDGAPFAACASPLLLSEVALGDHGFQVRLRDATGEVDATPASQSWTVVAADPAPGTGCGCSAGGGDFTAAWLGLAGLFARWFRRQHRARLPGAEV